MTQKHFDAIISKNAIAQELRDGEDCGVAGHVIVSTAIIVTHLRYIEKYLGEGNQPSVADVIAGEVVAPF